MKTWKEAQIFCREKHTDLITIRNEKENQVFSGRDAWIGLYREKEAFPWKWSRGDKTASFLTWADNEPQNNEHCAAIWRDRKKWVNIGCNHWLGFICSAEKLVLVKEKKTWEEALQHCRSLNKVDPGSVPWKKSFDLATLITPDDHKFAQERAQEATTEEVWTGLRYLGDDWFWAGGEPVLYQNISKCPTVRCGVMEKTGSSLYGIRDCSQRRNFFCYKKR